MAYRPTSKIVQVVEHEHEYDPNPYNGVDRHTFIVLCEDGSIWQWRRNFDDNPVWSEIIPCIK